MYNKDNFFQKTYAYFKKVDSAPENEPYFQKMYHRKARCYKDEDEYDRYEYISRDSDGNITNFGNYTISPSGEDGCENFTVIDDCGEYVLGQADDGEISSEYWYTEDGVFRKGAYWGEMGSCYWTLEGESYNDSEVFVGFCKWGDFSEVKEYEDDPYHLLEPGEMWCPHCGYNMDITDDECSSCGLPPC